MNKDIKVFSIISTVTLIIIVGAALIFGSKTNKSIDGKVTIEEYSDFECPACKDAYPQVKKFVEAHKDKVTFVYNNYPLPQHKYAYGAATALEAAGIQGKYWEYFDKAFEKSPQLDKNTLVNIAKDLGLDENKFVADMDSQVVKDKISADQQKGNSIGLSATPTFVINGQKYIGWDENNIPL